MAAIAAEKKKAPAGAGLVPFTKASDEHTEPVLDSTFTPGAGQVNLGTFEVPAFGYLRHLVLLVEATGGAGAATFAADGPFSAIDEVTLTDVNGQPIVGPVSGFELMLTNKLGGYSFDADPKRSPAYSVDTATGNFSFLLRVPVEITEREALGALANLNASSTYRVRISGALTTSIWSAAPVTTVPTVRVRAYAEEWTPVAGMQPPALGTTQIWSKEIKNVSAGQQTHKFSRVGNAIRNLVFVTRDATGVRVDTMWPDPAQILHDGRLLHTVPAKLLRHWQQERYGYTGTQIDAGVYVLDFTHDFDGHPGGELRDQWLDTTQATRLEVQGSFGAAGSLTILTNDVLAFAGGVAAGE